MPVDVILLSVVMTAAALWAVMARSLLKGTIGLAITSATLTAIMFRLEAPLAAVFELSVCTGLITAVFASAISLTKPMSHAEIMALSKNKIKRYWYLPVIMVIAGAVLLLIRPEIDIVRTRPGGVADPRIIMWNVRQLELFAQITILLAGVFGIVILFKDHKKDD